jgi:hypothetical protein
LFLRLSITFFAVCRGGETGGLAGTGAVSNEKLTFTIPPARRGLTQASSFPNSAFVRYQLTLMFVLKPELRLP